MSLLVDYCRQIGHFQRNARLYLIMNALSGVTYGILLVLYNLYLASLGYGTDFIGLVLFVGTIGGGLAIFPAGICIDRYGGKWVLIWSSILIGIAGTGQILFRTPVLLLASGFLVGVGGAFILVINAPFLTMHSTAAERPYLFSLNIVVTLATSVLGKAVGGVLPIWFSASGWLMGPLPREFAWMLASQPLARSYQLSLLLAGIIAVPSFLPLFLMTNDRPEVVRKHVAIPGLTVPLRFVWRGPELCSMRSWLSLLRQGFRSPMLVMISVQTLISLGAGLFIPYFNIYFVQYLKASPALFGIIDGIAGLCNALLTLLAPWLAVRIGKVTTMVLTRLLSIPLMLIIGLTSFLPLAAVLYPLRQGLMDMTQGITQLFSMEVVSKQRRGLANSSYQVAYQGASAIGTPVGGLVIARLGFTPVFLAASLIYLLATLLLWKRFGDTPRDQAYGGGELSTEAGGV